MNLSQGQDTVPAARVTNSRKDFQLFALCLAGLSLLFIKPLCGLISYAMHSEMYSHVPLIPCVSFYLLWQKKNQLADRADMIPLAERQTSPRRAWIAISIGLGALAFYWFGFRITSTANQNDYLSLTIFAFISFISGLYLLLLGKNIFSRGGFPIAFLFFMVPFPLFLTDGMEAFFQHASASAAGLMLQISNAPVFRHGLEFRLPQITIAVAPECSGIRSTLVLFITSVIAGHLFLQSPWKKVLLTLFVIPLAIARNGFRIFTIAQLCIHRGPEMIDSYIHRRGGPIFFLLSLVPFFLVLFFLQKSKSGRDKNNRLVQDKVSHDKIS